MTHSVSGPLITLQESGASIRFGSSHMIAECLPHFGGRMSALRLIGADGPRDLIMPMQGWPDPPWRWPKTGAYPLFPYSNRIRNARLALDDRFIALQPHPDAGPHTVHGPAHLRGWRCAAQDAASATLALDYAADEDWPWAFQARQRFAIDGTTIKIGLDLTNTGSVPFPGGFGWHPYFRFGPDAVVEHDARVLWLQDADAIATGQTRPALPPHAATEYLSDWRRASIIHRDGLRLEVTADPIFAHLVCHRPDCDAYACIEPVSHVADAVNLAARGIKGTGVQMLEPGASLSGTITLRVCLPEAVTGSTP